MKVMVIGDIDLSLAEERILAWFLSREMDITDVVITVADLQEKQIRGDDYADWWLDECIKQEYQEFREVQKLLRGREIFYTPPPEDFWPVPAWEPLAPKPEVPRHNSYRNPIKQTKHVMPRMYRKQHR